MCNPAVHFTSDLNPMLAAAQFLVLFELAIRPSREGTEAMLGLRPERAFRICRQSRCYPMSDRAGKHFDLETFKIKVNLSPLWPRDLDLRGRPVARLVQNDVLVIAEGSLDSALFLHLFLKMPSALLS